MGVSIVLPCVTWGSARVFGPVTKHLYLSHLGGLRFSFSFSLGPQPMGWCHPHSQPRSRLPIQLNIYTKPCLSPALREPGSVVLPVNQACGREGWEFRVIFGYSGMEASLGYIRHKVLMVCSIQSIFTLSPVAARDLLLLHNKILKYLLWS